jgi:hypothetical protein
MRHLTFNKLTAEDLQVGKTVYTLNPLPFLSVEAHKSIINEPIVGDGNHLYFINSKGRHLIEKKEDGYYSDSVFKSIEDLIATTMSLEKANHKMRMKAIQNPIICEGRQRNAFNATELTYA